MQRVERYRSFRLFSSQVLFQFRFFLWEEHVAGAQDELRSCVEVLDTGPLEKLPWGLAMGAHGQLAVARGKSVFVHDLNTGFVVKEITTAAQLWHLFAFGDRATFDGVAFSPSGTVLAGSRLDGTIVFWSTATFAEVGRCAVSGRRDLGGVLRYSSNGKAIVATDGRRRVMLVDAARMTLDRCVCTHADLVRCATLSSDAQWGASGASDGELCIWEVGNTAAVRRVRASKLGIACVCFTNDGRFVLAGDQDHCATVWDTTTGERVGTFSGHTDTVKCICVLPDTDIAISGGWDGTIRAWSIATQVELDVIKVATRDFSIVAMALAADGGAIICGAMDGRVRRVRVSLAGEDGLHGHDVFCRPQGLDGDVLRHGLNDADR